MALSPVLLEVLACPEDKGPLYYLQDENALYNPRLTRRYRIEDDIPVMLIEDMAKVSSEGIKPTFDGGSSEDAAT